MTEQTEYFSRLLCFTPILGLVDLLLILHFFVSWWRSAKKTGWKIDFWFLTLSLSIFPSTCLIYPFSASIFNAPFTRGYYEQILPFIDAAFLISVLGYASLWAGRYLFDFSRGKLPLPAIFSLTEPFCKLVENNIKSKRGYLALAFVTILLGLFILCIQFEEGVFFNARALFLKQPVLRPIFNGTISLFPLAFTFLSLRLIQFRERRCLLLILVLFGMALFFGIRSLVLGGVFFALTYWIFYQKGRFSLLKLLGIGILMFMAAVILGGIRDGDFNFLRSLGFFLVHLVYGNNFSDTRDFAWILAFWDEQHLYGKTYVAAFLSFIPRFLSTFREEWSISMYTNALTNFDEAMPGLRPGFFGEAFLNFSYLGVILFGLLFGAALRYADLSIKEYVEKSKDIIKGYSRLFVFGLISCLSISAAMWSFYVSLLLNLALVFVRGPIPVPVQSYPRKPN